MRRICHIGCWGMVAVLALTSVGCQTARNHPTKTGAVTGALLGATAGALLDKDHPERGALIGAAAGGAVGAGVGHMIKKQQEAFNRIEGVEAQQRTIIIQQEAMQDQLDSQQQAQQENTQKPALLVTMQSQVLFPVGSSALSEAGKQKMKEVAQVLNQYPDSQCYVRGYTSSEGDDKLNFELSQRRAEVIRNELVANGVAASRLTAHGMGSSNPVATNSTEAGRAQNRRVEIVVVPNESAA